MGRVCFGLTLQTRLFAPENSSQRGISNRHRSPRPPLPSNPTSKTHSNSSHGIWLVWRPRKKSLKTPSRIQRQRPLARAALSAKTLLREFVKDCGVSDSGSAGGDGNRPWGRWQSIELQCCSGAVGGNDITVRERASGTCFFKCYGDHRDRVAEIIRDLHSESLRQLRTSGGRLVIARDDDNIRRLRRVFGKVDRVQTRGTGLNCDLADDVG